MIKKILKWKNQNVCQFNMTEYGYLVSVPKVYEKELLPLGVKMDGKTADSDWMSEWWRNNAIPAERDSIRLGLECVGVTSEQELKLLCRGLSLENHYWLSEEGEDIRWEDVNFWDNGFSDDIGNALFNHRPLHKNVNFRSPDSSLNGMLKKRWVERQGIFYLAKGGSGYLAQEVFNEKLASDLLEAVGAEHIRYCLGTYDKKMCCLSECMTDKDTELVPITQIWESIPRKLYMEKENERQYFERILENYHVLYKPEQIDRMLCVDYIIANTDRHYNNIGILLNKETGVRRLAPVFDNGTALWCHTQTKFIDPEDDSIMARPFCNKSTFGNWAEQVRMIHSCPHMEKEKLIKALIVFGKNLEQYSEMKPERIQKLTYGVLSRIEKLQVCMEKQGVRISDKINVSQEDKEQIRQEILEKAKCIEDVPIL